LNTAQNNKNELPLLLFLDRFQRLNTGAKQQKIYYGKLMYINVLEEFFIFYSFDLENQRERKCLGDTNEKANKIEN